MNIVNKQLTWTRFQKFVKEKLPAWPAFDDETKRPQKKFNFLTSYVSFT